MAVNTDNADVSLFLGAYWGPRQESLERCAERLLNCLRGLRAVDRRLSGWRPKRGSRKDAEASRPVGDVGRTAELFRVGVNRRDEDGTEILELGFSAGLWNGNTEFPLSCSATCGAWDESLRVANSFVLDLPGLPGGSDAASALDVGGLLIRIVVESWDPDVAIISTYALMDAQIEYGGAPVPGWLTFLRADKRPRRLALHGVDTEAMNGGFLLTLGKSPYEVSDTAARNLGRALSMIEDR